MIPLRKGTPSAALEIILDIPPLDLFIKQKALNSMLRVLHHDRSKWDGLGSKGIGHLRLLQNSLQAIGVENKVFDNVNTLSIQKGFNVDLKSFKSGLPETDSDIQCYTDGSKLDGAAGYGFGIYRGMSTLTTNKGYLGKIIVYFKQKSQLFSKHVTS